MAITAGKTLVLSQGWQTTKIAIVDETDWPSVAEVCKNVWDMILGDGRFEIADFTIRVVPSTVFLLRRVCNGRSSL